MEFKLIHTLIPPDILYSLPRGIKFINKNGREYLVIEELTCSKGHSLLSDAVKIHGEPSVKIKVKLGNEEGLIFIDAYWGSHAKLFSFLPDLKKDQYIADVRCPECNTSLIINEKCAVDSCESHKTIEFNLPGGKNKIYVCAKLGCPGHRIDIVDIPNDYSTKISEINFFGSQIEDNLFEGI
jgi:hypothetical protein